MRYRTAGFHCNGQQKIPVVNCHRDYPHFYLPMEDKCNKYLLQITLPGGPEMIIPTLPAVIAWNLTKNIFTKIVSSIPYIYSCSVWIHRQLFCLDRFEWRHYRHGYWTESPIKCHLSKPKLSGLYNILYFFF